MTIRPVVVLGDPVLRERAAPVERFDEELRTLVRDMFETMYHAEGVGLAAPQVGVGRRVIVLDARFEDEPEAGRFALVNPEIESSSRATDRDREGCLSIPGVDDFVERPTEVRVRAFTPEGEPVEIDAEGYLARILQHEIDHLDGILFTDRLSPLKRRIVLQRWRKLREEEGRDAGGRTAR